jgi:hypothetical protein
LPHSRSASVRVGRTWQRERIVRWRSILAPVTLLGAGWALIACGAIAAARRPSSRFGALLAAAGTA